MTEKQMLKNFAEWTQSDGFKNAWARSVVRLRMATNGEKVPEPQNGKLLEIRCATRYMKTVATDAELRCVIADLTTQVQEREAVLKEALSELIAFCDHEEIPHDKLNVIAAIKKVLE